MAELCRKHPERFPTFVAAVSLKDVEGSVAEARRAVKELGACGIQVYTPNAGRPLDDPIFEPVFATMAELDLPIWLHPARDATPDRLSGRGEVALTSCGGASAGPTTPRWRWCGWCSAGLFDRYPKLKIITHHLGGMIPYYDGRVGPGLQVLGARTSDEDYSKVLPSLKRPHLDYLQRFLRRHRDVRRRHPCAALRARILRRRPRGVRDRHAARPDRADHRGGQAARYRRDQIGARFSAATPSG